MANYQVNYSANETLVANTPDTVTVNNMSQGVLRVINETGTSPLFVSVGKIVQSFSGISEPDKANSNLTVTQPPVPTLTGQDEFEVPAEPGAEIEILVGNFGGIISIVSAGAMAYSVVSKDEEAAEIP